MTTLLTYRLDQLIVTTVECSMLKLGCQPSLFNIEQPNLPQKELLTAIS